MRRLWWRRNLGPLGVVPLLVSMIELELKQIFSCLVLEMLVLLLTRVRGAIQPGGMRSSRDSAVALGHSLIRLRGRLRMLTGLHIDPVLMIIKGK